MLSFMRAHYIPDRAAFVGFGIDHNDLIKMAELSNFPKQEGKPHDIKGLYRGGESREHKAAPLVFSAIATEGPSQAGKEVVPALILSQIVGAGPAIKYQARETGGKMGKALSGITDTFSVSGFSANYTDAGLFGFLVSAKPFEIEMVLKKCVEVMADITKTGLKDEEVQRGKNLLLSSILAKSEEMGNVLESIAEQAIGSERIIDQSQLIKMIDDTKTEDIVNVAKKLINGKPSMASVGLLQGTPYLDDLFK